MSFPREPMLYGEPMDAWAYDARLRQYVSPKGRKIDKERWPVVETYFDHKESFSVRRDINHKILKSRVVLWDRIADLEISDAHIDQPEVQEFKTKAYHCAGCGAGHELGRSSCSWCTLPYRSQG